MTIKTENLSDCSLQQGKAFSSIETQWSWDKMTGAVTAFSSMKAYIIFKFYRSFFLGWQSTTINVASQRQCPTFSPTLSLDAITKCQIHAQIISESLRSDQGWGLLKLRSLISPQAKFSILQKYLLDSLNHIHIWQVSPQLSCGDTYQI